jgi:hypothetical protein
LHLSLGNRTTRARRSAPWPFRGGLGKGCFFRHTA